MEAVLQISQCLWTDERKDGKGLIDKVAKHDLSHGKAILLLELAQASEAIAVFLVIKKNSDPSVRRKLVERVLFEASESSRSPAPSRQTQKGHA